MTCKQSICINCEECQMSRIYLEDVCRLFAHVKVHCKLSVHKTLISGTTQSASFLHFSICTANCKLDSRMLSAIELSVCTVHTRQISTTHYINILPKDSFILEGEDYSWKPLKIQQPTSIYLQYIRIPFQINCWVSAARSKIPYIFLWLHKAFCCRASRAEIDRRIMTD